MKLSPDEIAEIERLNAEDLQRDNEIRKQKALLAASKKSSAISSYQKPKASESPPRYICTHCATAFLKPRSKKIRISTPLVRIMALLSLILLVISFPIGVQLTIFTIIIALFSYKRSLLCPKCGQMGFIPIDTPAAQKILSDLNKAP